MIIIVLLLEGFGIRCGGGGGGFGIVEKVVVVVIKVVVVIGGGGCLNEGGGLKEGFAGGPWYWKGSLGFGCSMNNRGCTRAMGDDVRTSSSVVLEIVEKFV